VSFHFTRIITHNYYHYYYDLLLLLLLLLVQLLLLLLLLTVYAPSRQKARLANAENVERVDKRSGSVMITKFPTVLAEYQDS